MLLFCSIYSLFLRISTYVTFPLLPNEEYKCEINISFFFFLIDFYDWLVRWTSVRLLITELNRHEKNINFLKLALSHSFSLLNSFSVHITVSFDFSHKLSRKLNFVVIFGYEIRAISFIHEQSNSQFARILFRWALTMCLILFSFKIHTNHTQQYTHRPNEWKVLLWSWQLCAPKFRNPSESIYWSDLYRQTTTIRAFNFVRAIAGSFACVLICFTDVVYTRV